MLAITAAIGGVKTGLAQQLPEGAEFVEVAMVNVNCTTASVLVTSMVMSNKTELVHFPAEIDMNADEWENVTQVMAGFSTADSFLFYVFNNTRENDAERIANTLTNQLNTVFGTSFTHNSTYPINGYVNVTYNGNGVGNLTQFTESLMRKCLVSDLDGFSSTFIPITKELSAYTGIGGFKESGDFNWAYFMGVMYLTSIQAGVGQHIIDILELLNVESLAPSPYARTSTPGLPFPIYMSIVMLTITSDTPIEFVSCTPELAQPPQKIRGWYVYQQIQPTQLYGYFSFGWDNTPVTKLSLTFSGVVIPEFTALTWATVWALILVVALTFKKWFNRLKG
ncbi:MAG: hypothetical protein NZ932_05555 [Candidatus Bathyarchaeota archaeon]|nr:hypothetical protein [Candidatus Bathyarchaeota archaeon]